ncbi:MAG: hypothetical protein ABW034_13785 [Steroidobacteraceae bacterium]
MFNRSLVCPRTRLAAELTVLAALVLVTGCAKHDETTVGDRHDQEVSWARAALERNPQLEVVATDTEARTFTLKHRGSGAVQVVSLDKLAAIPVADLTAGSTPVPAAAPAATPDSTPATSPQAETVAATPPTSAPPAESSATTPAPGESGYTIQREGGQLRVSGPGVSIVSASAASSRTAAAADTAAADSPIVCEDGRFLHLDRRNIRVNGTAVIARNGCELHITNSTIEATGAAISALDATVHIANSEVSGQTASVEASGRAKLFVRSSTFRGIARRNDPAEINDQGGNTWR